MKKEIVFMFGKIKFDEELPDEVKFEIYKYVENGSTIVIGDAPGADRRIQEYLKDVGYDNVIVYTADIPVRNNVGNWNEVHIHSGHLNDKERHALKDVTMETIANKGFGITSRDDRSDSATMGNILRLLINKKAIQIYDYKDHDWIPENFYI